MPDHPPARRYGFPLLALTISLAVPLGTASRGECLADSAVHGDIEQLIQQLDASRFNDREGATDSLVALGRSAIQPVALHFLDASPEAAWRIKRVLEQIATGADDEETSLKAIAVLIVLDHQLDESLAGLLDMWRDNRSKRAIDYLVSQGATIQHSGVNRFALQQPQIIQIREFNLNQQPTGEPEAKVVTVKNRTESETRTEIERVVAGDFEEVQTLVFSHLPDTVTDVNQQRWDNEDIVFNQGVRVFGGAIQVFDGNLLEIGDTWRGNSEDLARIPEIHSLYGIRFENQSLTQSDIDSISMLANLKHFGLANTRFRGSSISKLKLPDSVSTIEIAQQEIDRSTIRWLDSLALNNLILDECEFAPAAQTAFSDLNELTTLELRRIRIDRNLFQQFGKFPGLNLIQLSVCRFEPNDYREFVDGKGARPVIRFNPVAFLGVQALGNGREANSWSCQVEMVVPGSGADKAGLKTGDIIESVNGSPIAIFEELRMYISQCEIGEKMDLQVLRGAERLELTATLGENPGNRPR